jgi:benzoyl-CoA reductase/2-hydroxyglutaryl-CoA dehydratase subunit BcrC/BadD/HgdB
MIKLDEDIYNKYVKLGRGNWGKGYNLLKTMYLGYLQLMKDEEITPVVELSINVFLDILKARKNETPIIMYPFNFGPEIFHAMDITPMMQEMFSVGLAPSHLNEVYLDFTNKIGYGDNPTLCNAQRPLIGAFMQGGAPIPDLLFFLSTPCNPLSISYQVFQQLTGVPSFNIDIPYWAYEHESEFYEERTVNYIIDQLKNLISWLEEQTKQKLDLEKFQQTMLWLNQAREYALEFNELLKTVPCPANSVAGYTNTICMATRGGNHDAVKATKFLRDSAAENVKNGIAGVPDEKVRIAWPYTHVFFDFGLFPWLEREFNAVTILDLIGFYQPLPHDISTTEKCFESLAKGTLDFPMIGTCRGPIEYYIDFVINYVKDYKVDCVIFPMQFACKHAYLMARVTSEAVREETGLPTLIFGVDPYDSREVTSEAIRGKISEFLTQIVI